MARKPKSKKTQAPVISIQARAAAAQASYSLRDSDPGGVPMLATFHGKSREVFTLEGGMETVARVQAFMAANGPLARPSKASKGILKTFRVFKSHGQVQALES